MITLYFLHTNQILRRHMVGLGVLGVVLGLSAGKAIASESSAGPFQTTGVVQAETDKSPRDRVLNKMKKMSDGVHCVDKQNGILACSVTVILPDGAPNAHVALQVANTVAAVQARAEVARYLAGEYATGQKLNQSQVVTADRIVRSTQLDEYIFTSARARFANGQRLLVEHPDAHSIRVVYVWNLPWNTQDMPAGGAASVVASTLDSAMRSNDLPSPDVRIIKLADQTEALIIVVKTIESSPVPHNQPCVLALNTVAQDKGCHCDSCRHRAIQILTDRSALQWIENGDVAYESLFRKYASKTSIEQITKGKEALDSILETFSHTRELKEAMSSQFNGQLGPEWYALRIAEIRVASDVAVGVTLIPLVRGRSDPATK